MVARNPYLLLGVDYGCAPDAARKSFARAARRIRRAGTDRISTEDLTWALNEIQNNHTDPFNEVDTFRVPADPQVFTPVGEGFFAPAPTRLARRTETTQSDVDEVATGFAEDVDLLMAEVLPHVVRFDYGYQTSEGTEL